MPRPPTSTTSVVTVGIRALRQEAATHVRRAANGQHVIVTVGGEPTAMLGPITATASVSLGDLVAVQAVIAPRRRGSIELTEPIPVFSGSRLDRLLREIR